MLVSPIRGEKDYTSKGGDRLRRTISLYNAPSIHYVNAGISPGIVFCSHKLRFKFYANNAMMYTKLYSNNGQDSSHTIKNFNSIKFKALKPIAQHTG